MALARVAGPAAGRLRRLVVLPARCGRRGCRRDRNRATPAERRLSQQCARCLGLRNGTARSDGVGRNHRQSHRDGGRTWEFDLEGIFSTDDPRGGTGYMLFHYDYFEEARAFGKGTVGWYILRIARGANPVEVANTVDAQFANSPNETKTSTEQAFVESFSKQFGNIALIVSLILGAVFFTLLLVSGNTMAQSVRERISELAVLKTLGFPDRAVLAIVLSESILIMLIGGLLGLGIGWLLVQGLASNLGALLPGLFLSPQAALGALGLIAAAGIAAGIFPALTAMRLSIVDALARG
jgi:putative ABC transport system permease protein